MLKILDNWRFASYWWGIRCIEMYHVRYYVELLCTACSVPSRLFANRVYSTVDFLYYWLLTANIAETLMLFFSHCFIQILLSLFWPVNWVRVADFELDLLFYELTFITSLFAVTVTASKLVQLEILLCGIEWYWKSFYYPQPPTSKFTE